MQVVGIRCAVLERVTDRSVVMLAAFTCVSFLCTHQPPLKAVSNVSHVVHARTSAHNLYLYLHVRQSHVHTTSL